MPSLLRTFLLGACIAGLLLPATTAAAPQKMFWASNDMDGRNAFPTLKNLGVDVYQTGLAWNVIAPTQPANPEDPNDPAYVWPAGFDDTIAEAQRYGMDVALMLVGVPAWANAGQGERHAPDDPQAFAAFAAAAAKRYPQVRTWMIWGEPDFGHKFQPLTPQTNYASTRLNTDQQEAPREYARMLDAAYGALKAVSPSNRVVGGMTSVSGQIRSQAWVRYMRLPNGKPPRMDLYGHNPFSAREPNLRNRPSPQGGVDFSDLGRLQKAVNRNLAKPAGKKVLRLFLSEFSIPTGPDSEFNFYTTPQVQAKWITSAFKVAAKLKAYGLGWIHLYDDPPGGSRGGLLTYDGKRKLGYRAFKAAR